jgi:hypothetical protein
MVGVEEERRRAQKETQLLAQQLSWETNGWRCFQVLSSSIEVSECRQNSELDKL